MNFVGYNSAGEFSDSDGLNAAVSNQRPSSSNVVDQPAPVDEQQNAPAINLNSQSPGIFSCRLVSDITQREQAQLNSIGLIVRLMLSLSVSVCLSVCQLMLPPPRVATVLVCPKHTALLLPGRN